MRRRDQTRLTPNCDRSLLRGVVHPLSCLQYSPIRAEPCRSPLRQGLGVSVADRMKLPLKSYVGGPTSTGMPVDNFPQLADFGVVVGGLGHTAAYGRNLAVP